jgi:hypothetical protein
MNIIKFPNPLLREKMPEFDFVFEEEYDTTSGSQELSCTAGSCELVDLGEG